jgi:hypothetical protein
VPKSPGKWIIVSLASVGAILLAAGILLYYLHERHPLTIQVRTIEPKLTELDVVNNSNTDQPLNENITATWSDATLSSTAGLSGFDPVNQSATTITFQPSPTTRPTDLHPKESRAIGWIRLSDDSTVQAQFETP